MGVMKRKFIGLWECSIFGLPVRCTGRCQEQCVCKSEMRLGPWQPRAVFTVPFSNACLFFCEQSQCQASRWSALEHCQTGLQAVYVAWPSWESPLFLFFVSAEGEAMCRNRLVLLGSLVACPQSGLGPVCTACIPQGPGLQISAEASCLVCSSVPGKPCHTQPGPLWVHPVSAVAVCLGAIGSGQICGCAVNLSSFLEGSWWLRRKEEQQNVKPSSVRLTWLLITTTWNEEEAFDFLAC